MTKALREGFTTGSAATAAALAALDLLRTAVPPQTVNVPLPPFEESGNAAFARSDDRAAETLPQPRAWLRLPVTRCAPGPAPELAAAWAGNGANGTVIADPAPRNILRAAHASVIKDGGDDPDATSGACITVTIVETPANNGLANSGNIPGILIKGGPGVGRVTLPGLPVPVGEAAINPVPRRQMTIALRNRWRELEKILGRTTNAAALTVFISVPEGFQLAKKTFNPRLGIVNGISILGTQGTVRPYSHDAWKATIEQGLAVARATDCREACLTTGRRSERLLMARYPHLPECCFVQVADFAEFSLHSAGAMGFERLVWGCFFGKLVKLAQGHAYTHAKDAELDMKELAQIARQKKTACAADVARCITAAHALELLLADPAGPSVLEYVARRAVHIAQSFAGRPVSLHLFHTDGRELLAL
jgi:cobalt-precorrin-5B (C1)-methyltransferase